MKIYDNFSINYTETQGCLTFVPDQSCIIIIIIDFVLSGILLLCYLNCLILLASLQVY